MKKTCVDGNTAAAHIAYSMSEVSAIYPITPSSPMAEVCDEWQAINKPNIFGNPLKIVEMQSEAGAAGAVHGSLIGGALSTTFTASQGLLLMIPNMYKIAGELLPCVFHVAARALATHALSIFGDHSDVMACRGTGFAMLCSNSVQESMDFALASHIASLNSSVPFLHFFDGFRTSHEIQKIDMIELDDIKKIVPWDKINEFKNRRLNPFSPKQMGTAQNPDIYFQNREANNSYYNCTYEHVVNAFNDIKKITGRQYAPFEYYGDKNATNIVVVMGSATETIQEYIDYANSKGNKFGLIKVRLYRPFNSKAFCDVIPNSCEKICVLDRTKESGSLYEPLALDVISALNENNKNSIKVIAGRYGLGGKEFSYKHSKAIFDNMQISSSKNHFTVGINDDKTHTSLNVDDNFDIENNCYEMKFYGLGSDGTVSANKNSIKIIGENTEKFVQGYFEYDSKKSGSVTISHLRVSDKPIKSTFTLTSADFVACHNYSFIGKFDILSGLKKGGTVLLNTTLSQNELSKNLPDSFVNQLKEKNAKLYTIDATKVASMCNLGNKINIVMQTAFFKITNIIDFIQAINMIKNAVRKTYGKKGEAVVNSNLNAVDKTLDLLKEIDVKNLIGSPISSKIYDDKYYNEFILPIELKKGDELPVSKFSPDGSVPTDTSKFEKRGVAEQLPKWISENCIQCGQCVMSCPHSCLQAKLFKNDDDKNIDASNAFGVVDTKYKIQLSPLDCTGCGVCSKVCPAKNKALQMVEAKQILEQEKENLLKFEQIPQINNNFVKNTPKSLQFEDDYFKFSGACAGCGETPYIRLATKLFGDKMIIANATGCSSIYGGSAPTCPYTKNSKGHGPSWANSLFEDNAEFGLGIAISQKNEQTKIINLLNQLKEQNISQSLKEQIEIIDYQNITSDLVDKLKEELNKESQSDLIKKVNDNIDNLIPKSIWIIGGDGWAYDIGYGGLDHVLNSKENVNILVLDTEVYSNTGGQSSKSTPRGATAKFATAGKKTAKKDLALIAMANSNCYVAQVSLGADMNQTIKAFTEAQAYNGPSLIIAYAPCINHGVDMSESSTEMRNAVRSGYWTTFRFNPTQENALTIDSPEPTMEYREFLLSQNRYRSLQKINPEQFEILLEESKNDSIKRRDNLKKFKNLNN